MSRDPALLALPYGISYILSVEWNIPNSAEGSHSGLVHALGHRLRRGPAKGGKSAHTAHFHLCIAFTSFKAYHLDDIT